MNEHTMDHDSGASAAEKAFKDLRTQVLKLHEVQEQLIRKLDRQQPVDYAPTLGEISKDVQKIETRLQSIERAPALSMAPADYQRAIHEVGARVMSEPANKLTEASGAMHSQSKYMGALIGTARTRRAQLQWLLSLGAAAFVAGLVLAPLLARALPFGWDAGVAATVMKEDRWNAGMKLLYAGDPQQWLIVAQGIALMVPNHEAIAKCRNAAAKLKKPQSCAILVSAP